MVNKKILEQFHLDANHNHIYNETGFISLIQHHKFHKTKLINSKTFELEQNYIRNHFMPSAVRDWNHSILTLDV